ncbi:hypothetical protein HY357_03135 [Candidatus Roizmanbacteria bacterium]|nr:hypothetical protein [Candidatus Roizmanbacteria bacterium]
MVDDDWKHVDELGDIDIVKDTKYWFKRDIQTIKTAIKKTIQYSLYLLLISVLFSIIISYSYNSNFQLDKVVFYTIVFFPIALLGYFLIYIMVKKGYNIDKRGTSIDVERNPPPETKNFTRSKKF